MSNYCSGIVYVYFVFWFCFVVVFFLIAELHESADMYHTEFSPLFIMNRRQVVYVSLAKQL